MNTRDEEIRDALTDRLTQANIDARSRPSKSSTAR